MIIITDALEEQKPHDMLILEINKAVTDFHDTFRNSQL